MTKTIELTPEEMVLQFLKTFQRPIKTNGIGNNEDAGLQTMRFGLIAEEFGELLDALYGEGASEPVLAAWEELKGRSFDNANLIDVADALADLIYVIYGAAHAVGLQLDPVVAEVHRSNMTKLDADGQPILREDGKILKSDLYEEADFASELARQDETFALAESLVVLEDYLNE